MKKFFGEFKKFITRGNVLDMAVGVIVGGAFTTIVNGLSNFVLKPIINYVLFVILGKDSLTDVYTFLGPVVYTTDADGNKIVDLANSFYIDWGSLINAIINFLIVAFVLFTIVRTVNDLKDGSLIDNDKASKADIKAMKAEGIKLRDREAVKNWLADKAAKEAEAKAKADAEAAEKARLDRLANPTTEDLLKEILALMKKEN